MVGWHHRLNGHESEQTPGESERQGSLACCSSWSPKELNATKQQQLIEHGSPTGSAKADSTSLAPFICFYFYSGPVQVLLLP